MAAVGKQAQIATLHKLYGDRYDQAEAKCLLQHHDWDDRKTINFIQESEPSDVRKLILRLLGDENSEVKKDEDMVRSVSKGLTTAMRQFACEPCDQVWWSSVPINKPVSKCKLCRSKYDPIPKEMMWGWAIFKCECGKEFSGFGQMGVTRSECYRCGKSPYPSTIRPPNRRRTPKSKQKHKCDAPDCPGCGYKGNDTENDMVKKCIHPRSREGKAKVIVASQAHVSTGSTISSFRDQDELCSAMYNTSLSAIRENLK
ncbi:shiftless antiviral inhibitor of ribosomal frameshifting protein homolog [Ylistrum balloti]|uniref:shiftless antiviral inhibitor of ribosomal frameshifting protein homolog n=1 Tax=Ylistrum balloti TaxID=509963 RepID=UPI00290599F9|nr:shiftless antiviral inhibitor of ribosomal frameshifting protein homolog [Ylistrum balloti]